MGGKHGFQVSWMVYIVFLYNYYKLSLFSVLIAKLDQESNFQPCLAWTWSYKSRIGTKREENIVFKGCEWYYIVYMYNYDKLTLILVLIVKFD